MIGGYRAVDEASDITATDEVTRLTFEDEADLSQMTFDLWPNTKLGTPRAMFMSYPFDPDWC